MLLGKIHNFFQVSDLFLNTRYLIQRSRSFFVNLDVAAMPVISKG